MAGKYLKSIQIINNNLQINFNDNIDIKYITHIKYEQHFNIDCFIRLRKLYILQIKFISRYRIN